MNPISELYFSRCKDGKPTFWRPEAVPLQHICYYSDNTRLSDHNGYDMVRRIIGIGLDMEVNVGRYVMNGLKKDLPDGGPHLTLLLRSNAADEARHEAGFKEANKVYGRATDKQLRQLVSAWSDEANRSSNPISVAGQLEVGVFLVTLGLMRIVGNSGITRLAIKIAEDEYRHVQTNHAISTALGLWGNPNLDLIDSTLEWVFGLGLPELPNITFDKLRQYSRELLSDLNSPEFDDLTWYSFHHLPFELDNNYLYSERDYGQDN